MNSITAYNLLEITESRPLEDLKKVIDKDATEALKHKALVHAIYCRRVEMVAFLKEIQTPPKNYLIYRLVETRCIEIVKAFVDSKTPYEMKRDAITVAIKLKELDIVEYLLACGAHLSIGDPISIGNCTKEEAKRIYTKDTFLDTKLYALVIAIRNNNLETAEFLLDIGADPHIDILKTNIFKMACTINSLPSVELILKKKPPPKEALNQALRNAALEQDAKMVKLLIDYGANPYYYPTNGLGNALDNAHYELNTDLVNILKQSTCKPSFQLGDAIQEMRHLARVWGIKHEWMNVSSEGASHKNPPHTAIARALQAFIQDNPDNPYHGIQNPEEIINAFVVADELPDHDAQLANIQGGKPVVIPFGYDSHAETIIIYQNYLMLCGRAINGKTNVIQIDPTKLTRELLKKIYQAMLQPQEEVSNFFYKELCHTLNAVHITDISLLVKQKDQKGGFCTWNSPEAALFTFLAYKKVIRDAKQPEDVPELVKKAKQIYKDCTTFFRLFFTNEYIDKIPKISDLSKKDRPQIYLDYDLLELIRDKLEGDWHPERFRTDYLRTLKAKTIEKIKVALNRGQLCVMF